MCMARDWLQYHSSILCWKLRLASSSQTAFVSVACVWTIATDWAPCERLLMGLEVTLLLCPKGLKCRPPRRCSVSYVILIASASA
jgi:hypothetical protein